VSAKDKARNKEQKITITASSGLSKEEAEKMRAEAESHSEDDRRRMEEVEARNSLDGIVYQAEKMLRENREKIGEADVKKAEEAIEDAKKAVNEGGVHGCERPRKTSSVRCTRSPRSCTKPLKRRAPRRDRLVQAALARREVLPQPQAAHRRRSLAT